MGRRIGSLWLCAAAGLVPSTAAAKQVAVIPLEAQGTSYEAARSATQQIVSALSTLPGVKAISPEAALQLGLDLGEQARSCRKEIFCLVQVGEAVGADHVLVGDLARTERGAEVLRLLLIDVVKAAMVDSLRWVLPERSNALADAIPTALRNLIAHPDARLILEITPPDAELRLYGEPADQPFGKDVPFWSGTYYADVRREGYEPREVRIQIPKGGPTRVVVALVPDPLFVAPRAQKRIDPPKEEPRPPTQVPGEIIPPPVDHTPAGPSPFANVYAWGLVGAGGAAGVIGALLMSGAQSDYNALSGQTRFSGETDDAATAQQTRDSASSRFGLGSVLAVAGVGAGLAGVGWMLFELASGGPSPMVAPVAGPGGAGCAFAF
jgi:hypothetical protein